MKIGNRIFKPGLVPTIITLLLLPILIRLGFWQLDRAELKRNLIVLFEQQNEQGPLMVNDNIQADAKLNYRAAKIAGTYISQRQIFVDNKIHKGEVGVDVVTPFQLKGSNYSILVNRGWVPTSQDRSILPEIKTTQAELRLSGKLKLLEKKPFFMLGNQYQSNKGWPALVQWINVKDIENKSGLKLLPYLFLLDKDNATGYVRDWKPVFMRPEKSTSYAVQWFALALALLIIYIVVNLKKIESESGDAG